MKLMTNFGGGNFKKQFARADKWGARVALVLGEDEQKAGQVVIKDLRNGEPANAGAGGCGCCTAHAVAVSVSQHNH